MKKFAILLLILDICPVVNADTMLIGGLPSVVDTSAGQAVLTFDITSNGQLDNDHLYVWTYASATLDITAATNDIIIQGCSSRQRGPLGPFQRWMACHRETTDLHHAAVCPCHAKFMDPFPDRGGDAGEIEAILRKIGGHIPCGEDRSIPEEICLSGSILAP